MCLQQVNNDDTDDNEEEIKTKKMRTTCNNKHTQCEILISIVYVEYGGEDFCCQLIWRVQPIKHMMLICHLNLFLFFFYSFILVSF